VSAPECSGRACRKIQARAASHTVRFKDLVRQADLREIRGQVYLGGESALMYVTSCRHCDALARVSPQVAATFRCRRCDAVLQYSLPGGIDSAYGLYVTAAVVFFVANSFPLVAIEAAGNQTQASLIGAALALHADGRSLVAVLVLMTTVLTPVLELSATIGVMSLAKLRRPPQSTMLRLLRLRNALRPWSMIEIFILGTLVTITRLGNMASIVIGTGLWSLVAYMLIHAAANHAFDPAQLWNTRGTST